MNSASPPSLIAVATLILLLARGVPTGAEDQSQPTIRKTTRLVQLNAVVLDSHGRPMRGVSQDNFQVFDNGREQKLVHFSENTVLCVPPKRSPLVIGNRQVDRVGAPGVTVILVDESILQAHSYSSVAVLEQEKQPIRSARLAVLKFLSTLSPGEEVALYSLREEGIVVVHDFTDDSTAITAAAKTLGTSQSSTSARVLALRETGAERTLHEWLRDPSLERQSQANMTQGNLRQLGAGFQAIAEHLQGVPGRKNLIWISSNLPANNSGFDLQSMLKARDAIPVPQPDDLDKPISSLELPEPENYYDQLRQFARWLSNADISVYPIDANGLMVGGHSEAQWAAANLIASETGGRSVFDSNAIEQHLREIVAQNGTTYELGYYPGDAAWDGKYHHVQVKVRRDGLKVLCRKGYVAADAQVSQSPDAALRFAAKSAVDGAGVGVTLKVSSNPLEPGPETVSLKVDTPDIHFDLSNGQWRANLDVAFAELSQDGRILGGTEDRLDITLLPESYADAEKQGWSYSKKLVVSPSAEKIRVVVRDLATGAIGSVSVPIRHDKPQLRRRGQSETPTK